MKPATLLLGLIIVAPIGCLPNFDHMLNPLVPPHYPEGAPHFIIISKTLGTEPTGNADVIVQVKNDGDATGYNVTCVVYAVSQSSQPPAVVDSGFVTFAKGGSIPAGGDAIGDAIFSGLKSLDGDSLICNLNWLSENAGVTGQI